MLESVGGQNSVNRNELFLHELREALCMMAVAFEEGDGGINYYKKTHINMTSMVSN